MPAWRCPRLRQPALTAVRLSLRKARKSRRAAGPQDGRL